MDRWHMLMALFLAILMAGGQAQTKPPSGGTTQTGKSSTSKPRAQKDPKKKPQKATDTPAKEPDKLFVRAVEILAGPSEIPANPPSSGTLAAPDATEIIALMGNPVPFKLKAKGSNAIVIYSTKPDGDDATLQTLRANIRNLRSVRQRVIEVLVPHSYLLGTLVDKLKDLNYKNITFEAVGKDKIRIRRDADVSDDSFKAVLRDVQHLAWQVRSESPVGRVFYLKTSDAAAALGGGDKSSTKNGTDTGSNGASATVTVTTQAQNANILGNCLPPAGAGQNGKSDSSGNGDKNAAGDQAKNAPPLPPCPDISSTGSGKSDKPTGDDTKSAASVKTVNDDLLVFSGGADDDGAISASKRILTAIDFPRPEVIINTWSFQASSSDPTTTHDQGENVRKAIGRYNDAIQGGIDRGWNYLQSHIGTDPDHFFDPDFYAYLTQHYVADSPFAPGEIERLTEGPAFLPSNQRSQYGICEANKYCLGYTSLFHPLRPTLTDMLLAIIASASPADHFQKTILRIENGAVSNSENEAISAHQHNLSGDCDKLDRDAARDSRGGLPMYCIWDEVDREFNAVPSRVRPLRAAIANFLFHYKMAEQYPHEFSAYDLSQSAQELNTELNPLIVAFNRDIAALLGYLAENAEKDPATQNGALGFSGHGTRFINNGIITVRTISGKETIVDTITQNFFDATNPPSATDVINSIGAAEKNIPGVLKSNLTANEAATILGVLNSVTPTDSKIGRQFKIDITPRSLSGASSAELDISMTTQETAEPTLFSGDKSKADNISRVAQHNTQTKVRLESIKLFEISSFTAFLERSRRNFPLLLPFVELPYIGSFVSLPLPAAKEYHRSTAVMSAIVVPTAADLANGLRFVSDRVAVATADHYGSSQICTTLGPTPQPVWCAMRRAVSLGDLGGYSISNYNKAKVACLGNLYPSPFGAGGVLCDNLTLDTMPQDAP